MTAIIFLLSSVRCPTNPDRLKIVKDGLDRSFIGQYRTGLRDADSIKPPDISSGGSYSRYLNLTKYSPSAVAGQPSGSLFGYGEGIYIDNSKDIEKITDSLRCRCVPMNSTELRAHDFRHCHASPATGASANPAQSIERQWKPYGVGNTISIATVAYPASLEQQHLRGWVSLNEFRPRGVLIELDPSYVDTLTGKHGQVFITRDDLGDKPVPSVTGASNPDDPDASKTWRDGNGVAQNGVYRQRFDWPANGTIFAEGNVRVRNVNNVYNTTAAADPGRSLTIVSGNNIYIEGSVNAGPRKVVLLAKNNPIVNPTALFRGAEGQTIAPARTGTSATVTVANPQIFRPGDWVRIINTVRRVVAVNPTNIVLNGTIGPDPDPQIVHIVRDPLFGNVPYYQNALRVGKFTTDIVQRRFQTNPGSAAARLVFRHSALRKDALQLNAVNGMTPDDVDYIRISNKLPEPLPVVAPGAMPPGLIPGTDKTLRVEYGKGMPGMEVPSPGSPEAYANPAPTNAADLDKTNSAFELPAFLAQIIAPHMAAPGWQYKISMPLAADDTQVLNGYGTGTKQPLFFFLAALSGRQTFGAPASALYRKASILGTAQKIPMATSISVYTNSTATPAALTTTRTDGTTLTQDTVSQFGFNPQYTGPESVEDALTVDETFYTKNPAVADATASTDVTATLDYDVANATLDARNVALPGAPADGANSLSLKLNDNNVKFDAAGDTNDSVSEYFSAAIPIPYYRLGGLKIEGPADPYDATGNYQSLQPGLTMDIRAFVYAQEGSWMVVPGGNFDESIKTVSGSPTRVQADGATGTMDLNRDGVISREEKVGAYRMRRNNYQIVFTGAIMEKTTSLVADERDTTGATVVVPGEVQGWMDKWSTFNFDTRSPADTDFDDGQPDALKATLISQARYIEVPPAPGTPANFANISYNFDPSIMDPSATNIFVNNGSVTDSGLRLPVLPDLLPG